MKKLILLLTLLVGCMPNTDYDGTYSYGHNSKLIIKNGKFEYFNTEYTGRMQNMESHYQDVYGHGTIEVIDSIMIFTYDGFEPNSAPTTLIIRGINLCEDMFTQWNLVDSKRIPKQSKECDTHH